MWALLNPWKVLFEWAEGLYRVVSRGKRLGLGVRYPYEIGVTPAIVLFFGFAWIENVYVDAGAPTHIGIMAVFYTVVSLGGMFVFGKHTWLHYGDAFAVLYQVPIQVRSHGSAGHGLQTLLGLRFAVRGSGSRGA